MFSSNYLEEIIIFVVHLSEKRWIILKIKYRDTSLYRKDDLSNQNRQFFTIELNDFYMFIWTRIIQMAISF